MNIVDIVLIIVIAALVAFAVWLSFRGRSENSCGGRCDRCRHGCDVKRGGTRK